MKMGCWYCPTCELTAVFIHRYYISIFCNETNLCTSRKIWLFVWMIQISRKLLTFSSHYPGNILDLDSACTFPCDVLMTKIRRLLQKMYSVLGLVRQKVHYTVYQCVQDEKLLCGLPRRIEKTKIFGWQAFCSVFVPHLMRRQEF